VNVDLISLRQKYNYREHEGTTIKTDGRKLLLDALKHFGISRCDRILNYRGIFQLGPDECKIQHIKAVQGRKSEGYGANKA
jgi:hypothetical protein